MKKESIITYLFFLLSSLGVIAASADTVYMKDGEETKGIVVEEYADRIVISTYEGEKTFFKKNIERIIYDLTEQNLVMLGDKCMSREEFEKAYFYFDKAHRVNPEYTLARDRMNYVTGYFFRKDEQEKLRHVQMRGEFENWPASTAETSKEFDERLWDKIGIRIAEEGSRIRILDVQINSSAYKAGLRGADALVSVWGRMTGYMSKDGVASLLLEKSLGEIKMGIERNIKLKRDNLTMKYTDIIGGKLDMLLDGLTIVAVDATGAGNKAGFEKGDLIVGINGVSTRYMPLADAIGMIEDKNNAAIMFTIKRDMTVWRD